MHITVSGKQLELSDALRHRVWTMLDTISRKYFGASLLVTSTCMQAAD
jgi:ribosome-associated translation inhibitor RaiA